MTTTSPNAAAWSRGSRLISRARYLLRRFHSVEPETRKRITASLFVIIMYGGFWYLIAVAGVDVLTAGWSRVSQASADEIIRLIVVVLLMWVMLCAVRELFRNWKWVNRVGAGKQENQVRRIAGHEAAHATVALAVGAVGVRATTFLSGPDDGGHTTTQFEHDSASPLTEQVWAALVVAMAGHARDVDLGIFEPNSSADFDLARHLAFTILSAGDGTPCGCKQCRAHTDGRGEATIEKLMLHASWEARAHLRAHSDALSAITEGLVTYRAMNDQQLRNLYTAAAADVVAVGTAAR